MKEDLTLDVFNAVALSQAVKHKVQKVAKLEIRAVWGINDIRGIRFADHVKRPGFDKAAFLVFIRDNKIVYYIEYMYLNHAANALRQIVGRLKDDPKIPYVKWIGKNRFSSKAELTMIVEG